MNLASDLQRVLCRGLQKFELRAQKRIIRIKEFNLRFTSIREQSNSAYCVDLVRRYDYENYLGTLLLPKLSQRAAFALRAYNVELAQIPDIVSDKKTGLMRMQFWENAVNSIYSASPPHTPVALELAGACGYYKLSKHWLERIVKARAAHMGQDTFISVKSVEDYAEHVNSSLYYLLLECVGIKNVNADHAASHLGKAQGLVTVLRASPHHASNKHVYLPMEILAKHKVSQQDIIRARYSQEMKDCVFDIASLAHQHLHKARSLQKSLPDKSYLVFLNASVCEHYLNSLQKVDFNIFDGRLQRKNALLPYYMYMNKLKRSF